MSNENAPVNWIADVVDKTITNDTIRESDDPEKIKKFNELEHEIVKTIGNLRALLDEQYKTIPKKGVYDRIAAMEMLRN